MRIFSISLILISAVQIGGCAQGIKGKVFWLSGNQMPGPGKVRSPSLGISRDIYIFKATSPNDVNQNGGFYTDIKTDLVAQTTSDENGFFKVKLPPGEYSVFVKEPGGYFANLFDDKGRINVVKVNPKQYTWHTITVDYEAAY